MTKTYHALSMIEQIELQQENDRLRRALMDCDHQTDSMRIWGGMEWKYRPPQAEKIHRIARAALDNRGDQ